MMVRRPSLILIGLIGSNNTRFQYCKNSNDVLWYVFAPIQGYSGGELIAPELMNRVAISFRWKELLYHSGSSFNVASILQTRLIASGKDRKEG